MTTLYIKKHNITGLKYFGKTQKLGEEFYNYKGSGVYWIRHLKVHGDDITTEIYAQFDETNEIEYQKLIETSLNFSKENDIVNSKEWANLQIENGIDGNPKGIIFSEHTHELWSIRSTGQNNPMYGNGHKISGDRNGRHKDNYKGDIKALGKKISESKKGKSSWNKGKKMPDEHASKNKKEIVTCPYCEKSGGKPVMIRYHFDNCKERYE